MEEEEMLTGSSLLGDDGEGLLLSATSAHQAHAKGGDDTAMDTVYDAGEGTSCKKEQANTALCMLKGFFIC